MNCIRQRRLYKLASHFVYNTGEIKFILKEWLPTEEIFAYPKYNGYYSKDDMDMFIDQFTESLLT